MTRRRNLAPLLILVTVLAVVAGRSWAQEGDGAPVASPVAAVATPADEVIPGLVTFDVASAAHTSEPVVYPQTPPVGGPHASVWQDCGVYAAPVGNEHAVHSLEHGVVWITYRPGLAADEVALLAAFAARDDHVLLSPYPGLPAPIVASAWGRQLRLERADDPRLAQFVTLFSGKGPEGRASCSGGTTETIPFATPVATPAGTAEAGTAEA